MPFLRSLCLKQFRTFKDETRFDFAPLTIITGPNSSGKSSVLKALLLLQESIRRRGMETAKMDGFAHTLGRLEFGDYTHGLQDFKAAHARTASDDHLKISLGIENALGSYLPAVLDREVTEFDERFVKVLALDRLGEEFSWPSPIELDMVFRFGTLNHVSLHDASKSNRKKIAEVIDHVKFDVDEERLAEQGHVYLPTYEHCILNGAWFRDQIGSDYETFCENLQAHPTDRLFALWEHLGHAGRADVGPSGIDSLYKTAPYALTDRFESGDPSLISDEATDDDLMQRLLIKQFAEFTVRPLLRQAVENFLSVLRKMQFHQFLPLDSKSIYIKEEGGLGADLRANFSETEQRTIRYWMEAFGIGSDLKVSEGTKGVFTVDVIRDGEEIPLRYIGSGHRRLLAFLLNVGTGGGRHEGPLLIEEPEANLHPNLQSTLADVFVSICEETEPRFGPGSHLGSGPELPGAADRPHFMPNHQLIVETHSEYLIRRLQYLVATNAAKPEDIVIYYLGPDPEAEDYVKRITIAPSGKLSESFGPGFTDESTNLMIDLYKQTHQN